MTRLLEDSVELGQEFEGFKEQTFTEEEIKEAKDKDESGEVNGILRDD